MHRLIFLLSVLTTLQSSAQCYLKETPSWGTPLSTTGSELLDSILVSEATKMRNLFYVEVKIYAYDDSKGPNALAIPSNSAILMGKTLMFNEILNTADFNSIIAIMAHEFAHIVQAKYKMNSNPSWMGKYPELHADYLAGWYIGKMKYLKDTDVNKVYKSFYEKGDNNYYNEFHHGSKFERLLAFIQGHSSASKELAEAYNDGAKFVSNIEKKSIDAIEMLARELPKTEKKPTEAVKPVTYVKPGKIDVTLGGKYKKAIIEVCINCKLPSMSQIMSGNASNNLNGTKVEIGKLNRRKKVINLSKDLPPGKHVLCIKQIGPGYSEAFSEIEITSGQTIYKNASD